MTEPETCNRIRVLLKLTLDLGLTEVEEDSAECRALLKRFREDKAELADLRKQLADRFARKYAMARLPGAPVRLQPDHLRRLEHPEWWFDNEGRPVLIVPLFDYRPQLINLDRDSLTAFAGARGWSVFFPDYVSWWHPGWTSLIGYVIPARKASNQGKAQARV